MLSVSSPRKLSGLIVSLLTVVSLICTLATSAMAQVPDKPLEKTAEQANKNIQIFKGFPASKLRNTMFFFRYSLGVTCSHCHIFGQFDQDTKPAKAKAREMIKMVMDINKKHFEGRPEVNCYTCHQGSLTPRNEIPAVKMSVQSMLTARPGPPREEKSPDLPSVDDVISKYIAALGGNDALSKATSAVITGSMISSEGMISSREIDEVAPNMRLDIRRTGSEFGDMAEGFDGTAGWRNGNRGGGDLNGEALNEARMEAQFMPALHLRDLYTKLVVYGMEKFESEPAFVMTGISTITGKRERLYFGSQTGLLLRRSVITENYVGSITTDTYYEDYRPVNGIKTPMLISEYTPDSGSILKINRVEFNTQIDPAKFKKPSK